MQWNKFIKTVAQKTSKTWNHSNPSTYNDIDLSTIKSGIQKEIRRGNVQNAICLAIEADASFIGVENAKGNRTNVINRCLVILTEEICLANPNLPHHVWLFYKMWIEAKDEWPVQRQVMIKIIKLLAKQPKIRMMSDIAAVYGKEFKIPYARKWKPELFQALDKDFYEQTVQNRAQADYRFWSWIGLYLDGLTSCVYENQLKCLEKLLVFAHMKHDLAFYVLQKHFIENTTPLKSQVVWNHRKRKNKAFLIWNAVLAYNKKFLNSRYHSSIQALAEIYDDRCKSLEGWMFLYHGLSYLVWRDKIQNRPVKIPKDINEDEMLDLYSKVVFEKQAKVKSYFIDQHTRLGKRKYGSKAAKMKFATESARVSNEATYLCNDTYRQLYISGYCHFEPSKKKIKLMTKTGKEITRTKEVPSIDIHLPPIENWTQFLKPLVTKLTESELFQYPVRFQLLTGRDRPGVFSAMRGNNPVVYKGPFLPHHMQNLYSATHMMNVKRYYEGLLPINCQIVYAIPTPVDQLPEGTRNPENFGARCKIEADQSYPFLVMDDICRPPHILHYPTKLKGSKCWPANTQIADTSKSLGCVPRWSNLTISKESQKNYLLALLGSYIWQVTDTCPRNFVWIPSTCQVYRVDEENIHHPDQLKFLYKKELNKVDKGAKPMFITALQANWDCIYPVLESWKNIPETIQPAWVKDNINRVNSIENVIKLL